MWFDFCSECHGSFNGGPPVVYNHLFFHPVCLDVYIEDIWAKKDEEDKEIKRSLESQESIRKAAREAT